MGAYGGANPPLLINSIDLTKLLRLAGAGELGALVEYLLEELQKLAAAGADVALLASNTPLIVFDDVQAASPLPLISIVEAACRAAEADHLKRVALYGTRFHHAGRLLRRRVRLSSEAWSSHTDPRMRYSLFVLLVMMASIPVRAPNDQSVLDVGGSSIRIHFSQEETPAFRGLVERWAGDAADAVLTVYGRFPVPSVTIEVHVTNGSRVGGGVTYEGRLIRVNVGSNVTSDILRNDWVLTHEMFHLGFPKTEDNRDWMGEGLSTYLEPLARGRAGHLGDTEIWRGMIEGMPDGLPQQGDRGLDRTPTWGRTYWGGALFWLLADIEIRKRSGGRKSLDDALRAILKEGGDGSSWWPAKKIFERGDAAMGMPVLETLHKAMGSQPAPTDLAALWKSLGVSLREKQVTFSDDAPLAAVRKGLTQRSAPIRSDANEKAKGAAALAHRSPVALHSLRSFLKNRRDIAASIRRE